MIGDKPSFTLIVVVLKVWPKHARLDFKSFSKAIFWPTHSKRESESRTKKREEEEKKGEEEGTRRKEKELCLIFNPIFAIFLKF